MATPTTIKGDVHITGNIEVDGDFTLHGTPSQRATTEIAGVVKQAAALTSETATSETAVTVLNDLIDKLVEAGVIAETAAS